MIIYIVGISCVGKTTIGKMLAEQIDVKFYDLDVEVEKYYKKSIERIQNECFMINEFFEKASVVLDNILSNSDNAVIAGAPSGLRLMYWNTIKKHKRKREIITIHIRDSHENIFNRLTFYDIDSKPIVVEIDEEKKKKYLKRIKADYNYFKKSYERADVEINIENVSLDEIPNLIIQELNKMNVIVN